MKIFNEKSIDKLLSDIQFEFKKYRKNNNIEDMDKFIILEFSIAQVIIRALEEESKYNENIQWESTTRR